AEDDELNIIDGINKANEVCDIVVTTGGVSVGEKDLIEACLVKMDYEILFHGVDLKPGSPILAAKKENKILVALSGTPVAAATTFELFVRPMLSKILSCEELNYKVVKGIMQDEFKKASNKRRFLRVKIDQELENKVFIDFITQSPSQIHTMINSNGLLEVAKGTVVNRNDEVNVILL
ncbi:MAG: molybdopterin-binding protein, partial [Peptostreptococcaceae bacterium]